MEEINKPVLAMYDIRAKQDFIYKCNRLREIVGGSVLIRDCFKNYLYPKAEEISPKGIFHDEEVPFTEEGFRLHIEEGYIGEVIYEGGGNFFLLYKNEKIFQHVTYSFTKELMKDIGTLKVLGTCVLDVNFSDFIGDRERLYAKHRINEGRESIIKPWGTLPIVQVDRRTFMPLIDYEESIGNEKVSKESKAKYKEYKKESKIKENEIGKKVLDEIVRKKGEDSLLAVIYIDGNNMGAQVAERCGKSKTYEECVKALRMFSKEIQKDYIDDRKEEIDSFLANKYKDNGVNKRRLVIAAGDEINFICNAHDAFDCVKTYLNGLPKGCSACAGIAIFHSHAPYSEVYRIAEQCCESGKKEMKKRKIKDACFVDFHYCQGAIGVSLEKIREIEGEQDCSRPWLIKINSKQIEENIEKNECLKETCISRKYVQKNDNKEQKLDKFEFDTNGLVNLEMVEKMKEILNQFGRSNVKALIEVAKKGTIELELELQRIWAHMSEKKKEKIDFCYLNNMDREMKRKLIYDMVTVYVIWFTEE